MPVPMDPEEAAALHRELVEADPALLAHLAEVERLPDDHPAMVLRTDLNARRTARPPEPTDEDIAAAEAVEGRWTAPPEADDA
jgi:hypothetical protein